MADVSKLPGHAQPSAQMLLEENRRLREALERIASPDQPLQFGSAAHLREMARAALAGSVSDKDREPDEFSGIAERAAASFRSVSDNPKDQT